VSQSPVFICRPPYVEDLIVRIIFNESGAIERMTAVTPAQTPDRGKRRGSHLQLVVVNS